MKFVSSAYNGLTLAAVLPLLAGAQGTMIFDQQSSDESNPGAGFNTMGNCTRSVSAHP
jgi:hypothetical protein